MSDKNGTKEILQIVDELREKAEKFGTASAEFKEFEEKTRSTLDEQEEKNQKLIADLEAERKQREELSEKFDELQVSMARKTESGDVHYKDTPEFKALNTLCAHGIDAVEEKQLLRSDNDVQGGYLTSNEMDTAIIKAITEISPVRQVARVKSVGKKTLEIPRRTSIPTATYEGETGQGDDSTSTYGTETVTTFRLTTTVPYTMDLLLDSNFDIVSEITSDVAESFTQTEGRNFVNGDGAKKPEGFLTHPDIISGARTSENSLTITGDDIMLLTGDLKVGYNPIFGFNRQVLAFLRTLKGSNGQYLWNATLAPSAPNTIAGENYVVMQDVPGRSNGTSFAANEMAVIYGDFLRGYCITDRTGTTVIRDEFTRKKENIIELTFHRYNTGQVVLAEAFKALKIQA